MSEPILYLLPTPLCDENILQSTVPFNISIINSCNYFIVEELKTARRYLKALDKNFDIDSRTFVELNEHTPAQEIAEIFKMITNPPPSFKGESRAAAGGLNTILMSEAGCPGVADPGAAIVQMSHRQNIKVVPLIGPSSIIMAIMSSGLNGQSFAFNGYLPKEKTERAVKIKTLEKFSSHQSQWFIETPYRNTQLFEELLSTLNANIKLCLAANISSSNEFIKTKTISDWKKEKPEINKIPCVFGIGQ